jgi:hypothetical protein
MTTRTAILAGTMMAAAFGLTATKASAQGMPNMDMSWGMQSQMQLQRQGDAAAAATAQAYYLYMQQLRARGYRGPSLPTGVTPETLRGAMQRLQSSMDAYHAAAARNSNRTSNAIAGWDLRAIRGCQLVTDKNGRRTYVCPR